ncbi:MAG: serine/threonine protein kinase [Deltaproteobacteria bacterium]|nr:serine/threonine protein kinase [Deltaproteobacteria bacterium]
MSVVEPFGRYTLLRRLAVGGMGEVFLAQQPGIAGFSKQVVVKRIRPALVDDPHFVEMFLNEGRVAALLDHPNIVQIYELDEVDGIYFIAMEYVPGRDLGTMLEMVSGPLELSYALYILLNACEGLAFAHDAVGHDGQPLHLVHRDISPPNILVGYAGTVKISDFGIAKVARQNQQTAAGVLKGKFAYLSPEQARGHAVDYRSDIYAMGLLLFEVTVGRRANPANTDTAMIFAAAKRDLPSPSSIIPDYPPELEGIFLKATTLDPDDRYQHVKELQEDLLAFQVEHRLVVSAGRVGEWLQKLDRTQLSDDVSLAFDEAVANTEQGTTSSRDTARGGVRASPSQRPRLAFDATIHALRQEDARQPTPSPPARRSRPTDDATLQDLRALDERIPAQARRGDSAPARLPRLDDELAPRDRDDTATRLPLDDEHDVPLRSHSRGGETAERYGLGRHRGRSPFVGLLVVLLALAGGVAAALYLWKPGPAWLVQLRGRLGVGAPLATKHDAGAAGHASAPDAGARSGDGVVRGGDAGTRTSDGAEPASDGASAAAGAADGGAAEDDAAKGADGASEEEPEAKSGRAGDKGAAIARSKPAAKARPSRAVPRRITPPKPAPPKAGLSARGDGGVRGAGSAVDAAPKGMWPAIRAARDSRPAARADGGSN